MQSQILQRNQTTGQLKQKPFYTLSIHNKFLNPPTVNPPPRPKSKSKSTRPNSQNTGQLKQKPFYTLSINNKFPNPPTENPPPRPKSTRPKSTRPKSTRPNSQNNGQLIQKTFSNPLNGPPTPRSNPRPKPKSKLEIINYLTNKIYSSNGTINNIEKDDHYVNANLGLDINKLESIYKTVLTDFNIIKQNMEKKK